ncbi:hypothetical protein [Burkholderia gladioli]|uniref:hypothetical protein n=1 Tax=Burkholderia gladioli TaxID=28095 RepID=UPI00163F2222|nr:hypothetical protein [Burkholderia gladioli]
MTFSEMLYRNGRLDCKSGLPFSNTESAAWQAGWIAEHRNVCLDEAADLCLTLDGALNNSGSCAVAIRKLKRA